MFKTVFTFMLFIQGFSLFAYETENKLEILIISKVSKYIKWEEKPYESFKITVLQNSYGTLFDEIFLNEKINDKNVEISYIDDISQLEQTNILYIPESSAKDLENILATIENKNIVTISGIRGFAQKNGLIQIYFVSRKPKLKINLDTAKKENLKINASLLRISDVIKN